MNEKNNIIDLNKFNKLRRITINKLGKDDAVYGYYVMYPLSDEEEELINRIKKDAPNDVVAARSRIELSDGLIINLANIKVYGKIDFDDAADVDTIKNILSRDMYDPFRIPKGFDINTGTCLTSSTKFVQTVETFDFETAMKYYIFTIGSPEKILILKLTKNELKRT